MSHTGIHSGRSRRDANEPDVVDRLRKEGALVTPIETAAVGDLHVQFRIRKGGPFCYSGTIEVKVPGAKLSESQQTYKENAERVGALYSVAHSPDEAVEAMREWRKVLIAEAKKMSKGDV